MKIFKRPTHFAVIFDAARKTFRNEIYSDYKANRSEAPDDLAPQFEYIRKSVVAFNLPSVDLPNYEADDLIATYAEQILAEAGAKGNNSIFRQRFDAIIQIKCSFI